MENLVLKSKVVYDFKKKLKRKLIKEMSPKPNEEVIDIVFESFAFDNIMNESKNNYIKYNWLDGDIMIEIDEEKMFDLNKYNKLKNIIRKIRFLEIIVKERSFINQTILDFSISNLNLIEEFEESFDAFTCLIFLYDFYYDRLKDSKIALNLSIYFLKSVDKESVNVLKEVIEDEEISQYEKIIFPVLIKKLIIDYEIFRKESIIKFIEEN